MSTANATPRDTLLVWLDMEMTGLDPASAVPIELATIVSTAELEIIAEGPNIIIHQPDAILDSMDEWNTTHHGASGLTAAVRASTISTEDAQAQTLAFLSQYVDPKTAPLCGNSIGQDRRFLRRYMPELDAFFHYRSIDVSSIKELSRRWYSVKPPEKATTHRALDDIRESIEELRFYRRTIFKASLP